MLNESNQLSMAHLQLTWQALLWRLLLTMFLLLVLAGPGLTAFTTVTTNPGTCALPMMVSEQGGR